jgi:hypothetical protein
MPLEGPRLAAACGHGISVLAVVLVAALVLAKSRDEPRLNRPRRRGVLGLGSGRANSPRRRPRLHVDPR